MNSYINNLPQKPNASNLKIKDSSEINYNFGRSFDKVLPKNKNDKVKREISGIAGKNINFPKIEEQFKKKIKFQRSTKKLRINQVKLKKTNTDNLNKSAKMRKIKKNCENLDNLTSKTKAGEIVSQRSLNKIDNAINKFRINFQATMIQKIFRGYIFRKYNMNLVNQKYNTIDNNNYNRVNLNTHLFPSLYVRKKTSKNKNVLTISNTNISNTNFGAAPPKMLTSPNTNKNSEKDIHKNIKIQEFVIKKNKMADILVPTASRNKRIEEKTVYMNGAGTVTKSLTFYSRGDKFLIYKYLCIWKDRVYRYIILEKIFEYFNGYDFNIKKGYMCLNGKRDCFCDTTMGFGVCLKEDTSLYNSNTFNLENLNATFNKRYTNFQY